MLKNLFEKYNSDKGQKHHYDIFYDEEFKNLKEKEINFLEIGILEGSSLKTWIEFFPNATIFAIDILPKNSVEILNHPRVKYLQHDSTDIKIIDEIKKWNVAFDIVIDDGLHTPYANQKTFENIFSFLSSTGKYYIEDFFPMHIMTENDYNNNCGKFIKKNDHNWNLKNVNNFLNFLKKYEYSTFDLRSKSGYQDSFIIKIIKA
jgi:hypothetical protein